MDGTQRVERTRVQSALELAFRQWAEAERPHFENANRELRKLLTQEEELIVRTAEKFASTSVEIEPLEAGNSCSKESGASANKK